MMLQEKVKREMGIAIKKLTHFLQLTHLPQGFLFYFIFFLFGEKSVWLEILREVS